MNSGLLTTVLTIVLGGGGVAGLGVLLRLRVDKGAVIVETVAKGVLVLERLNDRLERDLAEERVQRVAAEVRASRYRAALISAGLHIDP